MTSSPAVSPRQRHAGPWIGVGAVTAYVLASPFFLRNTPDGALWVVLWIVLGLAAIALVTTGVVLAARSGREHLDELHHLDGENHDLAALAETRRAALENLVDHQLPAISNGSTPLPLPDAGGDEATSKVLGRAVTQLGRVREDQRAGQDAVQAAVVSLGRKVQASAHRIQEEAARMVQRHPTDADVLHTSMRVDHAAAQQARNAQSLAALCGEWPGPAVAPGTSARRRRARRGRPDHRLPAGRGLRRPWRGRVRPRGRAADPRDRRAARQRHAVLAAHHPGPRVAAARPARRGDRDRRRRRRAGRQPPGARPGDRVRPAAGRSRRPRRDPADGPAGRRRVRAPARLPGGRHGVGVRRAARDRAGARRADRAGRPGRDGRRRRPRPDPPLRAAQRRCATAGHAARTPARSGAGRRRCRASAEHRRAARAAAPPVPTRRGRAGVHCGLAGGARAAADRRAGRPVDGRVPELRGRGGHQPHDYADTEDIREEQR